MIFNTCKFCQGTIIEIGKNQYQCSSCGKIFHKCSNCNGLGFTESIHYLDGQGAEYDYDDCKECEGQGIINEEK